MAIIVNGTPGDDLLDFSGSTDAYELHGLGGHDRLIGGEASDLLTAGSGFNYLTGGGGDDLFVYSGDAGGLDRIDGGAGFDTVLGSSGDDVFGFWQTNAYVGIERIDGNGGTDVLRGSTGDDSLDLSQVEVLGISLIDLARGMTRWWGARRTT
jgi:Ca2+-binding RTX toxin-like protein